ncbi:MAG: ABC transporter permease [Wenzhouxiangella sp.]|jgi:predicted permease|nr:ABC transporter permease [Wenzhouxiangella sp.]
MMTHRLTVEFPAAVRRLLRTPAFCLGVVALLAVTIGGVAAVATAGYSLFAKPLPFAQSERLVTVSVFAGRFGMYMGISAALVHELDSTGEFGRLGIVETAFDLELESGESLRAARLDQHALEVLGVPPLAGRLLVDDDVRPGAEPVALIGESLAIEQFDSVDAAIGSRLATDTDRPRIVGVLPDTFVMPESGVAIWLPMELGPDRIGPEALGSFGSLTAIGRLSEGETPEAMRQRLVGQLGNDPRLTGMIQMLEADFAVRPLRALWVDGEEQVLLILGVSVALVLIASVLNVAGLWMARWFSRMHELAIQSALGGGRGSVLIAAGIEYLILATAAVVLAFPIAALGIEFLGRVGILEDHGPLTVAPGAATAVIALATVLIAALPVLLSLAWQLRGVGASALSYLNGGGIARRIHGARLRQMLMVAQIGIAFSLLLVLGLLLSSWNNLLKEDIGLDRNRLVALQVDPVGEWFADADVRVAALAESLAGLPGVEGVSWSDALPFGRREMVSTISLESSDEEMLPARPREVGPDFFHLAGIELLQGRRFEPGDALGDVRNVIVDELFADRYFGGNALGQSFGLGSGPDSTRTVNIIGVVASVRHMSPDEELKTPTVYSYQTTPTGNTQLLLRTALAPDRLIEPARTRAIDALGEERIGFVASFESLVRRTVRDREPQILLMGVFSGLALVLVFYGLYALQSYQMAARTAEFGLRKVLGAPRRHILGQGLKGALLLLLPGLAIGMLGAWAGARLVASRLYAVSITDPVLWGSVTVAIGAVITAAALVPALRALRVAPMDALRHE